LILQDGVLYAALDDHGVYVSRDQGESWQACNEGLATLSIRDLLSVPGTKDSFLCVLGSKGKELGGIYRSDDQCRSWRKVSGGFPVGDAKNLEIAPSNPDVLYLAMRDRNVGDVPVQGGLYRSGNGGQTWTQVLRKRFAQGLAVHPTRPDTVLIGLNDHPYHDQCTGDGILGSQDGGKTWKSLNDPSLTLHGVTVLRFDAHHPDRVFAGTGGNAAFVTELTPEAWEKMPTAQ
jgi:photosystem II stability/assembly factor-like uncharacterized protein